MIWLLVPPAIWAVFFWLCWLEVPPVDREAARRERAEAERCRDQIRRTRGWWAS